LFVSERLDRQFIGYITNLPTSRVRELMLNADYEAVRDFMRDNQIAIINEGISRLHDLFDYITAQTRRMQFIFSESSDIRRSSDRDFINAFRTAASEIPSDAYVLPRSLALPTISAASALVHLAPIGYTAISIASSIGVGIVAGTMTWATNTFLRPNFNPVYNAIAEPNGGNSRILLDRVPTKIFFNIGPPLADNLIENRKLSAKAIQEIHQIPPGGSLTLTITMVCHVCTDTAAQIKSIDYYENRHSSTTAVFDIVPNASQASLRGGSSITFSIDHNGTEFDFLNNSVGFGSGGGESPPAQASSINCAPNLGVAGEPGSDLIIRATRSDGAITVSFATPNSDLAKLLYEQGAASATNPTIFRAGAHIPDDVTQLAESTYVSLKALVEQAHNP
jgi:hypothetical protein